jgi:hypothetical protein
MDQPNPTTTEILTGESPAKAIQALHRTNLIREARASCALDGDTQSEGDSYVLISEDRLKRYESELAALREKVRRLEGAEAENAVVGAFRVGPGGES